MSSGVPSTDRPDGWGGGVGSIMNNVAVSQPAARAGEGVSVIVRTACLEARRAGLERALESIFSQPVPVEPIIVVNGTTFSPKLFDDLSGRPELKVAYMEKAGLPGAMRLGRSLVTCPFFSFLDDDDIYLPGCLARRLDAIQDADVLVTSGFGTAGQLYSLDPDTVNADPLRSLLKQNWLASCAALYRSSTISVEYFGHLPDVYEWTALAFELLAAGKKIHYVGDVTYRLFDTPGSVSKGFRVDAARVQQRMLERAASQFRRPDLSTEFRRQIREAAHCESESHWANGDFREAWRCHLNCLRMGGLRHITFIRHLVCASIGLGPSGRAKPGSCGT